MVHTDNPQPTRHPRKCTTHSTRTKQLCERWAMKGQTVCMTHGGKTPQALARAEQMVELAELKLHGLVVLGAGDEMTLRFKELPPPPAGWKRDFLLYNVGWDKDANLNTVLGHHVDPLPYRGMSRYPPGLDDTPPDSPAFTDYLRIYQTRRFSMRRFWGPLEGNRQVKIPLSGE